MYTVYIRSTHSANKRSYHKLLVSELIDQGNYEVMVRAVRRVIVDEWTVGEGSAIVGVIYGRSQSL